MNSSYILANEILGPIVVKVGDNLEIQSEDFCGLFASRANSDYASSLYYMLIRNIIKQWIFLGYDSKPFSTDSKLLVLGTFKSFRVTNKVWRGILQERSIIKSVLRKERQHPIELAYVGVVSSLMLHLRFLLKLLIKDKRLNAAIDNSSNI